MAKKKRPRPIAPKPIQMKSRKRARQVTSLFHKLTRQIDDLKQNGDDNAETLNEIRLLEQQIDEMGGREEYQRASQLSTKFHSTSKWVLKVLGQKGWLHGRVIENADADVDHAKGGESKDRAAAAKTKTKTKHQKKRTVNILEIGAINVELLTAASKTKRVAMKKSAQVKEKTKGDERNYSAPLRKYENVPLYNIRCRAIDIRSSHELIEEQDFLTLPLPTAAEGSSSSHYDVIVCSMVLNCVTSPTDRGKMLSLIHKQLSPGGLCFLTIPKLCLSQSKYIDRMLFEKILQLGVGFRIEEKKDSPKVAFWVLSKPEKGRNEEKGTTSRSKARVEDCKDEWSDLAILHRGKKYRNDFAVILEKS